jgi:hypothetical protein
MARRRLPPEGTQLAPHLRQFRLVLTRPRTWLAEGHSIANRQSGNASTSTSGPDSSQDPQHNPSRHSHREQHGADPDRRRGQPLLGADTQPQGGFSTPDASSDQADYAVQEQNEPKHHETQDDGAGPRPVMSGRRCGNLQQGKPANGCQRTTNPSEESAARRATREGDRMTAVCRRAPREGNGPNDRGAPAPKRGDGGDVPAGG